VYQDLRKVHDVEVLGVSRDSVESHERFRAELRLPFPLISDADGAISKRFGVARLWGLIPLVKRVTFVVDSGRIIRGMFHHEMAIDRHVREVRACLEALRRD
jgi:thioredoxin-dependent peroxiredoxin